MSYTTGHMSTKSTPECLLRQIAQIHRMDHGTVSVIRQGPHGPYYNHQCYENGRNVSRYVPAEQVPELEQAIEGYRRFQELVKQYVQLRVEQTRAERQAGSKKRVLRCFQWNRGVDRRAKAPEERHVYSQSAGTFPAKLRRSGIELPPPASELKSPTDPMPLLRSLAPSINVGAINMALRSSPRRVRRSWVRVPPVELGDSRRNGQVPVQPRGWRGLSSPGIEPTGRNEDEPHRMSLVMLKARRRRASGALCEGRCSQETQSPYPANSVGVSVVSTSVRHASDKRGGPNR